MKFSNFFIERPVFASVLSLLILIVGTISVFKLPITEYPQVVPPSIVVTANYPGANPKIIADSVAAPLEQAINGVDNLLYMSSQSTADGRMTLTATFAIGSDADTAQVLVQNRVNQVMSRLPQEVQKLGVTTVKSSPSLTMIVHLTSPDNRYDLLYLSNFANLAVKDSLMRINGVGNVGIFGSGDYSLRIWLNPDRMASLGLSPQDVIGAIRNQNQQAAAGTLGAQPYSESEFQILINIKGRLSSISDFSNIVVKTSQQGDIVRLNDVAKIELGSNKYTLRSLLNNQEAVAIPIFQGSDSNAIEISDQVRSTMSEISSTFPEGVEYEIAYDSTGSVRASIKAVISTLVEATVLVVLVILLFLQNWRVALIPIIAVPVSLIGTFSFMHLMGYSLNTLSLFGLVLAIGIVVDDAIVVVENYERNLKEGMNNILAAKKAMGEVTGPIIATTLVLISVFIPTALMPGLTGLFYQQFAMSILVSTIISAFNSLTLSPALCALLLKHGTDKPDIIQKAINGILYKSVFRPFNKLFSFGANQYQNGVKKLLRVTGIACLVYVGLIIFTIDLFKSTPTGYIPNQDKLYLISIVKLPSAASLDRTEAVLQEMGEIASQHPAVADTIAYPGLNISGFTNSSNSGVMFITLDHYSKRDLNIHSAGQVAKALGAEFRKIDKAFIAIFPPPPVRGLSATGGFKLQIEDKANYGFESLYGLTQTILMKANQAPELTRVYSNFKINVPQLDVDVDRDKAITLGINLDNLFKTIQGYLGSVYVNDFNILGRNYQVTVQADAKYRQTPEDIKQIQVPNDQGELIPLSALVTINHTSGPDQVMHYNSFVSADINGSPAPGFTSDQAKAALVKILNNELPTGVSYEWTELSYQQELAGDHSAIIFALVALLVFMVLAAQYESLIVPLAIIFVVPTTITSAFIGIALVGDSNNIFTQIGILILTGLATKNSILIVEFAQNLQSNGMSLAESIKTACKLRFRPIIMTSVAFILGVLPMAIATGAGAEMRQAMGITVFSGMIGVTFFSLVFTPVFYFMFMKLQARFVSQSLFNHPSQS